MMVADVTSKGGVALNDEQLKTLLVGKAHWLRNNEFGYANSEIIPVVKELNPLR